MANFYKVTVLKVMADRAGVLHAVVMDWSDYHSRKLQDKERRLIKLDVDGLFSAIERKGLGHTDKGFILFDHVEKMDFPYDDICKEVVETRNE